MKEKLQAMGEEKNQGRYFEKLLSHYKSFANQSVTAPQLQIIRKSICNCGAVRGRLLQIRK